MFQSEVTALPAGCVSKEDKLLERICVVDESEWHSFCSCVSFFFRYWYVCRMVNSWGSFLILQDTDRLHKKKTNCKVTAKDSPWNIVCKYLCSWYWRFLRRGGSYGLLILKLSIISKELSNSNQPSKCENIVAFLLFSCKCHCLVIFGLRNLKCLNY